MSTIADPDTVRRGGARSAGAGTVSQPRPREGWSA